MTEDAPVTIRLNPLKGDIQDILKKIESELGCILVKEKEVPHAYTIYDSNTKKITSIPSYSEGLFYIQNLSSALPVHILSPHKNSVVLDMCAAPGSKTTQLAASMNNTGSIVAADTSRDRLYKLKANLARMGVTNTQTVCFDGRSIWKKYPEYFDFVLLDAPCSMDQVLPHKKINELANKQKWLLRSAISCTKPGGYIVYSTCTSSKDENENVIAWIEEKEKGNISIVEMNTIPKDDIHESFFVTKIHKIKSTVQEFFR